MPWNRFGCSVGGPANATAAVEVWVQSDDGTFDPSTSMKRAAWTVNVTEAGAGGWRVAALLSAPTLPVEGGTVRFRVEGLTTSGIKTWRIQLLPYFDLNFTALNFTDAARVNASMQAGIGCLNAVAEGVDTARCQLRVVPPGSYLLAVTASGATHILLPNMTEPAPSPGRNVLSSAFGLFSVSPNLGSIGGGTLVTLAGQGFSALQPSTAVIVIKVCHQPRILETFWQPVGGDRKLGGTLAQQCAACRGS